MTPPTAAQAAAPIFIGGMPRSGTTLLRTMLDSHPAIACGPELRVFPTLASLSSNVRVAMADDLLRHYGLPPRSVDAVFADLMTSFLEPFRLRSGKRRIAEKTPANALHFGEVARLFPESFFIQIIRDGRDVVASLLRMDWRDAQGAPMRITRDPYYAAALWAEHVHRGRDAKRTGGRYFELRYEALVEEPRSSLMAVLSFLGEEWSEDVLEFSANPSLREGVAESSAAQVGLGLHRESVGRWKQDLSASERSAIEEAAGDMLSALGYGRD